MSLAKINHLHSEIKKNNLVSIANWKQFKIKELFDVRGTKTTPTKTIRENQGDFPHVTTQATNNGVRFYSSIATEKGNVLVVDSAVLGYMTYQEKDFSASDHVEKLIPKFSFNKEIGLFICSIWNSIYVQKIFNYQKKASQKAIKECSLLLPTTINNEPDFNYMENCIKTLCRKKINFEKIQNTTKEIKKTKQINTQNWQEFKLIEIFPEYSHGKRLKKLDRKRGKTPLVTAGQYNNGIAEYVERINKNELFEKCVTIDMFGNCFYQENEFICDDNVYVIKDIKSKNIGLFLASVFSRNINFDFKKQFRLKHLINIKIKLPVNENNEPDFNYMENYIKNLYKKIEKKIK